MKSGKIFFLGGLLLATGLPYAYAYAEEKISTANSPASLESKESFSSISLTVSADNAGGRGSNISADIGTSLPLSFQIGAGSTKYKSETVTEKTSSSFFLGTTFDFSSEFSVGVIGDSWGLKDELVVNTGSLPISYKNKYFGLKLKPRSSEIRFRTNTIRAREIIVQDESLETKVSLNYYKPFRLTLGYDKHNYDADLTRLSGDRVALIFTDTTLSLASSLILEKTSVDFSYDFEKLSFGLMFANSVSAFDESISRSTEIYADFYVLENWILGGSIGTAKSGAETNLQTGEATVPFRYMGLTATFEF